jgi:lysophospholipase L1-like esterase
MAGIEAVRAGKAFIMLGLNDFAREGRSVDEVFDDYRRIVARLEKGGARVFIESTLACNADLAGWISCAAIQGSIRELNRRLAALASGNIAFIDLNAALAGQRGLKPEYTYDGVHLNGEGYRVWRRQISRFIPAGR